MKRSAFGDPQPANRDEMEEAIGEHGGDVDEMNATIEHNDETGVFHGWTAEVRTNEDGIEVFSTVGYASKDALLADLRAAGITDIDEF